ncbi:WD_0033/WD_0034 family tandem repeat-containing protein [Wolbachia endosymbiont (group B) of Parapoynx stratiotata]|uniref:WD_0033/WD_0034 family tandem repeat-containing protein n=1 Tax=Wolbachia endosymbiont (group B) of Parapoynx stratiotata TaxID=2954040 RepID=UPI002226723D|nr:magnesium transporter [Wolbachia endosymbiont (group B) of Parapoynx stratiotata]
MPKYEELNGTQQELYGKLQAAMEEHENIIDLLTGFSKEDLLKILTTVKCIEFEDGEEHTLTPLAYAINLKNSLNSQRYITNILSVAKEKDILEEVLTTADIKIKLSNGQEYTSTPLVHAIILNKQRGIQAILNVAKRNSILEKVLTTANIKIRLSDDQEHTLTPLGCAINLINQEVSQKSIKAIIDVAQDNDMLEKVFASIKKDHLNKTKNILEILKNQEQDEEQKAKIDGWLKILAKSISSCESKDDPNTIEMYDRVEEICEKQEQEDWKLTLERIVPNHENKDKCEIFSKIFNEETFKVSLDSQRNADMITLIRKNQPDYESKEQSLVDESSVPQTEGNITDESSTSEISIMPDCESNEQSSMAESIVPKTEGNITDESSTSEIESSKQKDKVKTTNKPIIIGCVYGAIAALATGGGCFAAGVALPILALIGIAAALVTGLVAGGIKYVISKPSENLDRVNVGQGVVDTGVNITA